MSGLNLANGVFKGITVQAQKRLKTDRIDCLTAGKIKFECPIETENLTGVKTYTATVSSTNSSVTNFSISNSTYYELNGDIYLNLEGSFKTFSQVPNGDEIASLNISGVPNSSSNNNTVLGSTEIFSSFTPLNNIVLNQITPNSLIIKAGFGGVNNSGGFDFDFKFNIRYRK